MGKNDAEIQEEVSEGGMEFGEKSVRRGFIRKVYSIISVQLLLTCGTIALFLYVSSIKTFLLTNTVAFWGIFITCCLSTIVILIAMACVRTLRVSFPLNFLMLALFTIAESVLLGQVCMFYPHETVLIAAGVTAAIVIGLTLFAFQTKIDFTMFGGILFSILMVFVMFGLLMAILPAMGVNIKILHLVYSGIGALIFSVYLVYDTQMMMGGNHKYSVSPEEYIFAAIAIYLDIINIFLYILRIVGASEN